MAVEYVAYTWNGRRLRGQLDVDSVDAAYDQLSQEDLVPYRLRVLLPSKGFVELFPTLFAPKTQNLIDFSRQLASLLKSGVSLRRSLDTLLAETTNPGLRLALRRVLDAVEAGGRFSDELERYPSVFPESYVRLVRVGEAAGGLVTTLERLAEALEQRKSVQEKVRGALMYPAISLVVAAVAGTILVMFSLPALLSLLAEFGGELPLATRILQAVALFLAGNAGPIIGTMVAVLTATTLYFRTKDGKRRRDAFLLKVPVVGGVLLKSNMFSFTSTMKTLIQAGVPMVEAMRLSGDSVGNVVLREALQAATAEASTGSSLADSFRRQQVFPSLLIQALVTGESSGTLSGTLGGLADYYQKESERSVGIATQLIQPVVILGVAGVVGFIAVAVLSGIYNTLGQVE